MSVCISLCGDRHSGDGDIAEAPRNVIYLSEFTEDFMQIWGEKNTLPKVNLKNEFIY